MIKTNYVVEPKKEENLKKETSFEDVENTIKKENLKIDNWIFLFQSNQCDFKNQNRDKCKN